MITVENLEVAYGQSVVIPDISFSAEKGEILGIVGRNGMGKTTLFRALIGMIPAKSGEITVDGKKITKQPSFKRVANGVAFVPQGRMIFPYLSVYENLISGVRGRPNRTDVEEIYALFPVLQEMRNRKGGNLSGGQQQQLAIGRALMTKPSVLLLDEPTEGIQPSIIKDISRSLREIRDLKKLTIVVSEQVLSFVLDTCDSLTVIDKGKLTRRDRREDVDADKIKAMLAV
ncbi:urea ABC transporter ATP-binding subunit UrtE [Haloferula chungangensis]|uniref:Urea ABC transporter ATP-binding subunit UrtE n=1 Tax=Haloferula chungangensis TaxID=1048331 RepID=A0ABW2LBA7_9BACT